MSRLLARSLVVGSTLSMLIACAQIADIQDPDPSTSASKNTPSSPGSSSSSGSSSGTSGSGPTTPGPSGTGSPGADGSAPTQDAGGDTSPPAPVCVAPLKPNDQSCTASSQCCSSSCHEDGKCHENCRTNDFCDPNFGNGDDCCIGTYCPVNLPFRCVLCKPTGSSPDGTLIKSCCSRSLGADGKCL